MASTDNPTKIVYQKYRIFAVPAGRRTEMKQRSEAIRGKQRGVETLEAIKAQASQILNVLVQMRGISCASLHGSYLIGKLETVWSGFPVAVLSNITKNADSKSSRLFHLIYDENIGAR